MGILVKICGINSLESADAAVRGGADFAGLMFHAASPRNLSTHSARVLADRMRGRTRLVAVVSDLGDDALEPIVKEVRPEILQLHGNESPERVASIRTRFGLQVLKSIAIADASDFARIGEFEAVADLLMFDAKAPADAARGGGHGSAFDWQLLRGRKFTRLWLLAGGLNTENVGRAISVSDAPAVDVSSGVETMPGEKSPALIAQFLAQARATRFAAEERA